MHKACAAECSLKDLRNVLRTFISKEVDAVKKVEGLILEPSKIILNNFLSNK